MWQCRTCETINEEQSGQCQGCSSPRTADALRLPTNPAGFSPVSPVNSPGQPAGWPAGSATRWQCDECGALNEPRYPTCQVCGAARPNPRLAVSPAALNFGLIEQGADSNPRSVTLSNPGTGTLKGTVRILKPSYIRLIGSPTFQVRGAASPGGQKSQTFQVVISRDAPRNASGSPYVFTDWLEIESNAGSQVLSGEYTTRTAFRATPVEQPTEDIIKRRSPPVVDSSTWAAIFLSALPPTLAGGLAGAAFGLLVGLRASAAWATFAGLIITLGLSVYFLTKKAPAGLAAGLVSGLLMAFLPAAIPVIAGLAAAAAAGIAAIRVSDRLFESGYAPRLVSASILAAALGAVAWLAAASSLRAPLLVSTLWLGLAGLAFGLLAGIVLAADRYYMPVDQGVSLFYLCAMIVAGVTGFSIYTISTRPLLPLHAPAPGFRALPAALLASPTYLLDMYFTSDREGTRQVYRQDSGTGQVIRQTDPQKGECWMPRAGAGRDLYVACRREGKTEVYRQDANSGAFIRMTGPDRGECWGPALGPGGNTFFTCNRDGKRAIYYQDRQTGDVLRMTDPARGESWDPALGPAGELYFTSDRDGKREIYRLSLEDRSAIRMTDPSRGECWSPVLGPNDDLYLTCNRDGSRQVYRLDRRTGQVIRMTDPASGQNWGPVPGPGGNIYFTSNRSGKREIYRIDQKTGQVTRMSNTTTGESWTTDEE